MNVECHKEITTLTPTIQPTPQVEVAAAGAGTMGRISFLARSVWDWRDLLQCWL